MSDLLARLSELSPKRLALLAVELQAKLDAAERARAEPIAIVGMACRFPGSPDVESYWRVLRDGVDAISEIPASRWDVDAYYDPDPDVPNRIATRWGGFVDGIDRFEPQVFGISPREAVSLDPQQRMLLEVTWEALERAGIAPDSLHGSSTGVFVGVCNGDYGTMLMEGGGEDFDMYFATGNAYSVASGRISYVLGLQGPALSVDTACSSSLQAVHLAAQNLRSGACRIAIAGGSNAILSPKTTMALSRAKMMAPDGRCKPFDAHADGFVRGEGCGVVVLKRLSDARADGDPVLAVIRGSASNQDGRSNGLTAPNGPSQVAVIRAALADARVAASDVSYVEAHGTGTSLGDPIEASALGVALGEGRDTGRRLLVGSAKANIGHLESAAGIAGLIKIVLAMQHGEIPPLLHLTQPSPHIDWDRLPIDLPTAATPWPPGVRPRIAGVSSFGFSGSNVHIVVEEAPPADVPPPADALQVLALSARTDESLRAAAGSLAARLDAAPGDVALADVAHTLGVGRARFAHRLAVVASTAAEAASALRAWANGDRTAAVAGVVHGSRAAEAMFLFTGHGAQRPGMGHELYATEPAYRDAIDECARLLQPLIDRPLLEILASDGGHLLDDMAYSQPALFAVEYALSRLWLSWGVRPVAVGGHSAGEYVAAVVAGVMSLEDGLRLIAARGRLMSSLPPDGEMAAALASEARVSKAIAAHGAAVSIAAVNGPESVAISGTAGALRPVIDDLVADGVEVRPLAIPIAAHSPQVDPILDEFERVAATVTFHAPRLDVYSGLAGRLATGDDLRTARYWRDHLRQPVRFADAIQAAYDDGRRTFVEAGPHPTLIGIARHVVPEHECAWLPSLRANHDERGQLLASVALLWAAGGDVDWTAVCGGRRPRVDLPTYAFQRDRYWASSSGRRASGGPSGGHPLLAREIASPAIDAIVFETELSATWPPYLDHHRIAGTPILPSPAFLEMALAGAARGLGTGPWEIADFAIREPLVLDESTDRTVQLLLRPSADGAEFEIVSRDPIGGEWRAHASGTLRALAAPATAAVLDRLALEERCATEVDVDEYYDHLFDLGLEFGEGFRGLGTIRRRDGEAFGHVVLPEAVAGDGHAYTFHPALLDACFHLLGAALPDSGRADASLLIAIDSYRVHRAPGRSVWNHTTLRPAHESADAFVGDVALYDDDGDLVAEVAGVHLRVATPAALRRAIRRPGDDWLYEVAWRAAPALPDEATAAITPAALTAPLRAAASEALASPPLGAYRQLVGLLDGLARGYAARAVAELGGVDVARALAANAAPERGRLIGRLIELGGGVEPLDDAAAAARIAAAPTDAVAVGTAELALLQRSGQSLAAVARGELDPLEVLFPGGSSDAVEPIYAASPLAAVCNGLVADAVATAVRALPARPARLLEIGGGTGATTKAVLAGLASDGVEYCFTDISPLFVSRAEQSFASDPAVRCRVLDVERDVASQGMAERFDVIVAANVIHATADVRRSLANVRSLLSPGGVLVMVEGTRPSPWIDVTFGLTEGWWRFADDRVAHPLIASDRWHAVLDAAGFTATSLAPAADAGDLDGQVIVIAQADAAPAARAEWVVLGDHEGFGSALVARIERSGDRAALVADVADVADVAALTPLRIVDARWLALGAEAGLPAEDRQRAVRDALRGALALAQHVVTLDRPVEVWTVTAGAQAVAGDVTSADQAALWGFGRGFSVEHPDVGGGLLDLDPAVAAAEQATTVFREIRSRSGEDQVAWRAAERRVARLTALARSRARQLTLAPDGAYLVTGGLGGLGRKVAAWMASRGAGTVVLVGRTGLPPRDAWDAVDAGATAGEQIAAIRAIEAAGTRVVVESVDVGDRTQLAALIGRFGTALPPLRGIVHAAAALSNWSIRDMPPEALDDMLRPKVAATLLLHELTLDIDLDFFVAFSSTTALWGSRDLGHYAAANHFMDAFAAERRGGGHPALSVGWGTWDEMRVASAAERQLVASLGMRQMESRRALDMLGELIAADVRGHVAVADVEWDVLKGAYEARRARPFLSETAAAPPRAAAARPRPTATSAPALLTLLAGAAAEDRRDIVTAFLCEAVAGTLGAHSPAEIDVDQGLFEMGMDSLMAVELKSRIAAAVGATLPSTLTFNYPNVTALAGFLLDSVLRSDAPAPAAGPATTARPVESSPPPTPAATDDMSEDELAALLAARLRSR